MANADQAFCLMLLCIGLRACFVMVLYEIERYQDRQIRRVDLVRNAIKFVMPQSKTRRWSMLRRGVDRARKMHNAARLK